MSTKKSEISRKNSGSKIKYYNCQNFSCISCGKCCTLWDVPITLEEKEKIEKLSIPELKETDSFIPYKRKLFILKRYETRCVFLGDDNLCLIHKYYGLKYKPLACRLHPFDIFKWQDETVSATLKYDCPAVAEFRGNPITKYHREIISLADEISKKGRKATAVYSNNLDPGLSKLRFINNAYRKILLSKELDTDIKFCAAARLLEFHAKPENSMDIIEASGNFEKEAYAFVLRSVNDLRNILNSAIFPKLDFKIIFRYLISGYARIDEEVASPFIPIGRIGRAKDILHFILGNGSLQDLGRNYLATKGVVPSVVFTGMVAEKESVDRYFHFLASKLHSMHFCGNAAFRLTYVQGMRHLLLTYPIVFALAGMHAAVEKRNNITPADVSNALIIVDHSFSRSPFFKLRHVKMMTKRLCSDNIFPAFLQIAADEDK